MAVLTKTAGFTFPEFGDGQKQLISRFQNPGTGKFCSGRVLGLVFLTVCLSVWPGRAEKNPYEASPDAVWNTRKWTAHWIACPDESPYDYGVYHFRKAFTLDAVPASFVLNISADNRYRLFVNGQPVCWGPARGDLAHWYYETVDVASLLQAGENVLAVAVWNFGEYTPGAQMTLKTGLIVQGNTEREAAVNTDRYWKVYRNPAYTPVTEERQDVGCGDRVQGALYPWGWETPAFDDSGWKLSRTAGRGRPYGSDSGYDRVLWERDIPLMEESPLRMATVRRTEGGITVPDGFLKGTAPLTVPAGRKVSLLIDQAFLTTAYPELHVSGGRGASIRLTYSEALYRDGQKGNRHEVDGRSIRGSFDEFYPDGAAGRLFRPLWFRTYRYVQADIETAGEPLTLNDLYGMYTGYPFRENGSFESDAPQMKDLWTVGWRTARLCAHETYFDCPYYEQLQYVGDTRIQALISLYVDGDDRLMRKAIRMFDRSRSYEGITTSRYPSRVNQYIPPFSMYWINMVHDYWMLRDDPAFVAECIPAVKTILGWFAAKVDGQTGMLGAVPHWNFVDWPPQWPWDTDLPLGGVPPGGITGGSSILTLQLAYTLKDATDLLSAFGEPELAARYETLCRTLCEGTIARCWDENRRLLKDDTQGSSYSQHANIMGILSDAVPRERQAALFEKLNADTSLIQATFYYRFYLFRALRKTGGAERYTAMLQPWYDMLRTGLTTFAENPEPTRSDCHAWSASPNYDLLATVCGVEPAEPGFKSVRIEPHLGHLKSVRGQVPHPKGTIKVELKKTETGIAGSVSLPEGLQGVFVFDGKNIPLKSGTNRINQ
ncbi:MAG: glycoside hydrolase family 78 protein [Tannerella sp.]|nr:glycoside hydrolase family 78 protein [Tannerella sp.]